MNMAQTQVIDIVAQASDAQQLESLMRQGEISVGIYVPSDFERRRQQPGRPAIQLMVDGTDTVVQGAVAQMVQSGRTSPYNDQPPDTEMRIYYNPERRSPVNTVPGLIGVILTMTMIMFTAVAIVRERERGNLELLITTPVLVFDVPLRGTLLDVYTVSLLFIVANLALGLVISTLVQTQFQAMQLTFFILLPSVLLSGFMFPFDGMPRPAQIIAEALPMTHFMRLIRGVILRGASLPELSSELIVLVGFILAAMTLAILRFNKRLD